MYMSQKNIIGFNQNAFHLVLDMGEGGDCLSADRTTKCGDCLSQEQMGKGGDGLFAKGGDGSSPEQTVLMEIKRVIAEIMKGNFGTRANLSVTEKSGETLTSFNEMLDLVLIPLKISVDYFDRIANGNEMSKVDGNYPGDLGVLKEKINCCVDSLANVIHEAGALSVNLSKGMLQSRAKISGHFGKWAEMFEEFNSALESLVNPLQEIERVMECLGKNDFSIRVTGAYQGECARIKNSINAGIDNMANLMTKLRDNANQLSAMSEQMAKFVESSEYAAERAATEANLQTENVKYVPNDRVASDMKLYSEEVEKVVTVIDDIAAQISLLALNAAIESAAARDNGGGLAAIAEDVRKLAERTTEADRRLSELIRNAHNGIQQAIVILSDRGQTLRDEKEG
jgi:methyl-accepting chemotaxis protein